VVQGLELPRSLTLTSKRVEHLKRLSVDNVNVRVSLIGDVHKLLPRVWRECETGCRQRTAPILIDERLCSVGPVKRKDLNATIVPVGNINESII
jgi:hypothetical protein